MTRVLPGRVCLAASVVLCVGVLWCVGVFWCVVVCWSVEVSWSVVLWCSFYHNSRVKTRVLSGPVCLAASAVLCVGVHDSYVRCDPVFIAAGVVRVLVRWLCCDVVCSMSPWSRSVQKFKEFR